MWRDKNADKVMTSNDNTAIQNILCEFFEIAIQNILYVRKLYPDCIFVRRKKYGIVVYQSVHPELNEYITESLKAVKFHTKNNQLRKLAVCIHNSEKILERYMFDIQRLTSDVANDPLFVRLEQNLRNVCLRLQTSHVYLDPLPEDAEFQIQLHITEYSCVEFNMNEAYEDFPWIQVNAKESSISVPNVVPLHTVDLDSVTVQIYLEKNSNS